jgi:hypothetical protein
MGLGAFLGLREFWSQGRIIDYASSKATKSDGSALKDAESLLIFATSKQHTWLICSNTTLCCVLDDIRLSEPELKWCEARQRLVGDSGELLIALQAYPYKPATGKLDFGSLHKGWLYSLSLFEKDKVEEKVRDLILRKMYTPASQQ